MTASQLPVSLYKHTDLDEDSLLEPKAYFSYESQFSGNKFRFEWNGEDKRIIRSIIRFSHTIKLRLKTAIKER